MDLRQASDTQLLGTGHASSSAPAAPLPVGYATAAPAASSMTRKGDIESHLPAPQTIAAGGVAVSIPGAEAKTMDDYVPPPKPAGARCRLCDSAEDPHEMIAPCRCQGRDKYVHRDCLNQERALNANSKEFVSCKNCKYRYWIDLKEGFEPDAKCCGQPQRMWKFRGMVARDTMVIFILLQGIICLYAFVVERVDSCQDRWHGCGTGCGDVVENGKHLGYVCGETVYDPVLDANVTYGGPLLNAFGIMKLNAHYKSTYYFAGLLFFLASLGVFACCHSGCYFCHGGEGGVDGYTNNCIDNYSCYYCFNDCPCCWSRYYCCWAGDYQYQPVRSGFRPAYSSSSNGRECECCAQVCCNGCNCNGGSGGGGDCKCNDCKGGGGGDGAPVLLVIAAVILVILILVGFLYGLILITLVITKIVQKHYAVAQRRTLTRSYIVRDLDGVYLPPPGSAEPLPQGRPVINVVELEAFGLNSGYSQY
jgi:hypothetical protein